MISSNQIDGCQIWTGFEGTGYWVSNGLEIAVEDSPRAGGRYSITREARWMIQDNGLDDGQKARLTTILVDQRKQGVKWPKVIPSLIERAKNTPALPVHIRADRLLRFISEQSPTISERLTLQSDTYGAYAWSDSVTWDDVVYFLDYLIDRGWINGVRLMGGGFIGTVTMSGHAKIEEYATNLDSSQAFVAMWFDDSMNHVYDEGLRYAIEDAGYTPIRIDRKEHINKIDDEIIAELRRSRFVVADFTQGPDGARGGVYYEAGFAHGLGIPVIFTCREESLATLHFDTSHYSHIAWSTPQDLRKKLKDRILAVIGKGPGLNGTL